MKIEIEARFYAGDTVYRVDWDGEIRENTVDFIEAVIRPDSYYVIFVLNVGGNREMYSENEIFATREEAEEYRKRKDV